MKRNRPALSISDLGAPGAAAALGAAAGEPVQSVLRRLCAQSRYPEPYLKLRELAQFLGIPGRSALRTKRQLCRGIAAFLRDRHGEEVAPEEIEALVAADTQYMPQRAVALVAEFAGSPAAMDVITMGQMGRERYFGDEAARLRAQRARARVRDSVLVEKARRAATGDPKYMKADLDDLYRAYGDDDATQALAEVVSTGQLRNRSPANAGVTGQVRMYALFRWSLEGPENPLTIAILRAGGREAQMWALEKLDELVEMGHVNAVRYLMDTQGAHFANEVLYRAAEHDSAEIARVALERSTLAGAKRAARVALADGNASIVAMLSSARPGVEEYVQRLRNYARDIYGDAEDVQLFAYRTPFPQEEVGGDDDGWGGHRAEHQGPGAGAGGADA